MLFVTYYPRMFPKITFWQFKYHLHNVPLSIVGHRSLMHVLFRLSTRQWYVFEKLNEIYKQINKQNKIKEKWKVVYRSKHFWIVYLFIDFKKIVVSLSDYCLSLIGSLYTIWALVTMHVHTLIDSCTQHQRFQHSMYPLWLTAVHNISHFNVRFTHFNSCRQYRRFQHSIYTIWLTACKQHECLQHVPTLIERRT